MINNMKEEIKNNIDNPGTLEKLYREHRSLFSREFNILYPDIRDSITARIWHERLNFEGEEISWGTRIDLIFVIADADKRRATRKLPAIGAQTNAEKRVTSQHCQHCPEERRPLAIPQPLPLFALIHDARI